MQFIVILNYPKPSDLFLCRVKVIKSWRLELVNVAKFSDDVGIGVKG